jgi:hypothetical protein
MILTQFLGIVDSDIALDDLCIIAIALDPLVAVLVRDGQTLMGNYPRLGLVSSRNNQRVQGCLVFLNTLKIVPKIVPNPYSSITISPLPKDNLSHLELVNN